MVNAFRKYLFVVLVAGLFFLIACNARVDPGVWTIDGERVADGVIITHVGPEHCGWESARLLHIGDPLGSAKESGRDVNQYIRDPEGVFSGFADRFSTTYDPEAVLPGGAEFSGYARNGVELWISESQLDTAVYMVDGSRVERWPRADPIFLCA